MDLLGGEVPAGPLVWSHLLAIRFCAFGVLRPSNKPEPEPGLAWPDPRLIRVLRLRSRSASEMGSGLHFADDVESLAARDVLANTAPLVTTEPVDEASNPRPCSYEAR